MNHNPKAYAYLQGFQDGQEFALDFVNGLNPIKARSLKEAELILMEYS